MATRGYAHRIDVAAPAAQVWAALIDPALLGLWLGGRATVRAKAGGAWTVRQDGGPHRDAMIDVFEPGRRLRLIHLPPPGLPDAGSAMVEDYLLEPSPGGGTVLRLLGSGIPANEPAWDAQYRLLRVGNERALARLKVLVERQVRLAAERR